MKVPWPSNGFCVLACYPQHPSRIYHTMSMPILRVLRFCQRRWSRGTCHYIKAAAGLLSLCDNVKALDTDLNIYHDYFSTAHPSFSLDDTFHDKQRCVSTSKWNTATALSVGTSTTAYSCHNGEALLPIYRLSDLSSTSSNIPQRPNRNQPRNHPRAHHHAARRSSYVPSLQRAKSHHHGG